MPRLGYGEGPQKNQSFSDYTIVEGSEKLVELAKQECPGAKLDKGLLKNTPPKKNLI